MYSDGLALITPKSLNSFLTCTCGKSHWIITFLGFTITGSLSFDLWNITLRLTWLYGSHLSIITDWGFDGSGASLSIMTFLGGGGILLPDMVITFPFNRYLKF